MPDFQYLFTPLKVGNMTLKNRIIFGPHVTNHWPNHIPDDDTTAYYEERAKGGVGMIITGATPVDEEADYHHFTQAALWSDEVIGPFANIANAVHSHGAKFIIQLVHPGTHQNPDMDRAHHPAVSPSSVPVTDKAWYVPKELERRDIYRIQDRYTSAAVRAKAAGVDGVEVHFAHGYLISQFLTPLKNRRTDEYGGSMENRLRFGMEVLRKVRDAVGPDFVVGIRINNNDMFAGSLETDEVAEMCKIIEADGQIDFINVSQGLLRSVHFMIPTHYPGLEPGYQAAFTNQIKAGVSLPVFMVGRINDPALAENLIAQGNADAVVMIRELIAEPMFAKLAQEGKIEEIRPCAYWNQGCFHRIAQGLRLECSINAGAGHERNYGVDTQAPAGESKKILIIGGGPGGMELARMASKLNHKAVIYEQSGKLGGQVNQLIKLPRRAEVGNWLDWLEAQLDKSGVTINLNQRVDSSNIQSVIDSESPDVVVIATGARPAQDGFSGMLAAPIPGWQQENVLTYDDVLNGTSAIGQRVLILDEQGERTVPGLAELLASQGKEVHCLTHWAALSDKFLGLANELPWVHGALDELGVKVTPSSSIKGVTGTEVTCFNLMSGREWKEEADTVVLVTMKYPNDELYKQLDETEGVVVHRIGDAVTPRWVTDAVREGTRLAHQLSATQESAATAGVTV
jgi:2,4-dienoyl-CoA reductase-like NADH-dependent reductase (Old Yellow Enzyme family)